MTFHQGRDVTIPGAAKEIALPMTGNGAVFDFRGPLPDGNGVDDLATAVPAITRMPQAADPPLRAQVFHQLLFEHAGGLIYQVAWGKALGLIFGHTAYALATVLAVFMGGLTAGSALIGRWTCRWTAGGAGETGSRLQPIALYAQLGHPRNALTNNCLFGRYHRLPTMRSIFFLLVQYMSVPPKLLFVLESENQQKISSSGESAGH